MELVGCYYLYWRASALQSVLFTYHLFCRRLKELAVTPQFCRIKIITLRAKWRQKRRKAVIWFYPHQQPWSGSLRQAEMICINHQSLSNAAEAIQRAHVYGLGIFHWQSFSRTPGIQFPLRWYGRKKRAAAKDIGVFASFPKRSAAARNYFNRLLRTPCRGLPCRHLRYSTVAG